MSELKIMVLCGGRFALPAIQQLAVEKYLCGIVIGKGERETVELLEEESSRTSLPFKSIQGPGEMPELETWIREINPDAVFSICFPYLLPESLLKSGTEKFINFHTGPLPGYRGPMPIFEVLRYGETETAVSVHFMDTAFDEGDLIFSETVTISKDDTFGTLAGKLAVRSAMVAQNMAQMLEYGSIIPREVQTESDARYFEKPEKEDTFIQWNRMDAEEIIHLINACNPWNNGADAILNGKPVKIISASMEEETHFSPPGSIYSINQKSEQVKIACLNNKLLSVKIISCEYGIVTAGYFAGKEKLHSANANEN
jgi:methionyl-tRNA formyltransferase